MKTPKSLMQEIEEIREPYPEDHSDKVQDIITRRSQPFTPEILNEYGFNRITFEGYNSYSKENITIKIYTLCCSIADIKSFQEFIFPLWGTIDEMENDLARVMESLK